MSPPRPRRPDGDALLCILGMEGHLLGSAVAVNPRSPKGRGTRGVDGDSASRAKIAVP